MVTAGWMECHVYGYLRLLSAQKRPIIFAYTFSVELASYLSIPGMLVS
jgi:hypothetical protein